MKKTIRFVIWICSKFTPCKIEQIIQGLMEVLANRNPEVKPKDDFKEKHSNYRNFFVDPEPPLKTPPQKVLKLKGKELLSNCQKEKGHPHLTHKKVVGLQNLDKESEEFRPFKELY